MISRFTGLVAFSITDDLLCLDVALEWTKVNFNGNLITRHSATVVDYDGPILDWYSYGYPNPLGANTGLLGCNIASICAQKRLQQEHYYYDYIGRVFLGFI